MPCRVQSLGNPPCDKVSRTGREGANNQRLEGPAKGRSTSVTGLNKTEDEERDQSDHNGEQESGVHLRGKYVWRKWH